VNSSLDYIDVDEDIKFAVTPDVLWIDDPDRHEALCARRARRAYDKGF
jgi:hypothetical protein